MQWCTPGLFLLCSGLFRAGLMRWGRPRGAIFFGVPPYYVVATKHSVLPTSEILCKNNNFCRIEQEKSRNAREDARELRSCEREKMVKNGRIGCKRKCKSSRGFSCKNSCVKWGKSPSYGFCVTLGTYDTGKSFIIRALHRRQSPQGGGWFCSPPCSLRSRLGSPADALARARHKDFRGPCARCLHFLQICKFALRKWVHPPLIWYICQYRHNYINRVLHGKKLNADLQICRFSAQIILLHLLLQNHNKIVYPAFYV